MNFFIPSLICLVFSYMNLSKLLVDFVNEHIFLGCAINSVTHKLRVQCDISVCLEDQIKIFGVFIPLNSFHSFVIRMIKIIFSNYSEICNIATFIASISYKNTYWLNFTLIDQSPHAISPIFLTSEQHDPIAYHYETTSITSWWNNIQFDFLCLFRILKFPWCCYNDRILSLLVAE